MASVILVKAQAVDVREGATVAEMLVATVGGMAAIQVATLAVTTIAMGVMAAVVMVATPTGIAMVEGMTLGVTLVEVVAGQR